MRKAVLPGSFDPFTLGHLDVLRRAAALFDAICVGVLVNPDKRPVFSPEERCEHIRAVIRWAGLGNVSVRSFSGFSVELAREEGAVCLLRGVRGAADMEYELPMETLNKHLAPEIETVYMAASPQFAHISSSAVRQIGAFGGSIQGLVPAPIQISIAERLSKR